MVFEIEKNMPLSLADFKSADIGVGVCVFWLMETEMFEKEARPRVVTLCDSQGQRRLGHRSVRLCFSEKGTHDVVIGHFEQCKHGQLAPVFW